MMFPFRCKAWKKSNDQHVTSCTLAPLRGMVSPLILKGLVSKVDDGGLLDRHASLAAWHAGVTPREGRLVSALLLLTPLPLGSRTTSSGYMRKFTTAFLPCTCTSILSR